MKIAIQQPNYLPWQGFFYKMARSDIFIFLDTVQYPRRVFVHRVKIKTPKGEQWLSVPVKVKGKYFQKISETEIQNEKDWRKEHLKTLELNYKKAKNFNYLFPEIKKILEKDWQYLSELNIALIDLLKEKLRIKTKLEIASNFSFSGEGDDLLINICKRFGADIYLSGKGGQKYQDEEKFKAAGIKLEYTDFIHPVYPQLWEDFIPNLSVIDLLFNCGDASSNILLYQPK